MNYSPGMGSITESEEIVRAIETVLAGSMLVRPGLRTHLEEQQWP